MKRSSVTMMLGTIVLTLALGGFFCADKAFADPSNACPTPTRTNYKSCTECNCKVLLVKPGNRVTVATASAILSCTKKPSCYHRPLSTNSQVFDLNNDTYVNNKDYQIALKCIGCCATPSPFR